MSRISVLQQFESELIDRQLAGDYEEHGLIKDIRTLLNRIAVHHDFIESRGELNWVCRSIIRWESFLRSEYGIHVQVPLPPVHVFSRIREKTDDKRIRDALEAIVSGKVKPPQHVRQIYRLFTEHIKTHRLEDKYGLLPEKGIQALRNSVDYSEGESPWPKL